jgi:hypothetical protein
MPRGTEAGEGHGDRRTDADGRCAAEDVAPVTAPTQGINEQLTSTGILDHRDLQGELRMSFRTQRDCRCNALIIAVNIHDCQYHRAGVSFTPVRIAQPRLTSFGETAWSSPASWTWWSRIRANGVRLGTELNPAPVGITYGILSTRCPVTRPDPAVAISSGQDY